MQVKTSLRPPDLSMPRLEPLGRHYTLPLLRHRHEPLQLTTLIEDNSAALRQGGHTYPLARRTAHGPERHEQAQQDSLESIITSTNDRLNHVKKESPE